MKNITRFLSGIVLLAFCSCSSSQKLTRIFIAGDSTAQGYDTTRTLQRGWGQYLGNYFDSSVEVVNLAKAGRSSGSYINEGRWDSLIVKVHKGDWVLIQFGHNDTSTKPERHVSPSDYQKNIIRFCDEVRAKKAHPIILTSIVMREFKDNVLVSLRPHFTEYVGLAREAAKTAKAPVIDLYQKTSDLVRGLGDEPSKKLYFWVTAGESPNLAEVKQDDTHLKQEGAYRYAGFVVEGIKEQNLKPLVKHLKK
ncbi:MAG TPA: rhamnogalacturonan acetylesterase [Bacteroidales bacterium]|nr:rhamnogalacturonan acetylesterase [Bacteroidales bacterium]